MIPSIQDWFDQMIVRTGFLDRYPHFAPELGRIDAVADEHSIMAVSRGRDGRVRLHVQTAFFATNPEAFRPVLQHELHHVIAGHLDISFHDVEEPTIMQVAKEITANENIGEPLPGSPHQWRDYEQYGIRPQQDTWTRYRLLRAARDRGDYRPPPTLRICCRPGASDGKGGIPVAVSGHGAGEGVGPGNELRVASAQAPAIDWAHVLHRFARSRLEPRPSLRWPSRLDPKRERIGELVGHAQQPHRSRLLVALDTSSSMPDDLFPRIAGELQALMRVADLVIVECDKQIQREYEFDGRLDSVVGRGGTDLRLVFAPEVCKRHRADGVVYFTDGEGPVLPRDPGIRTLWVLTDQKTFQCSWGQRVRMQPAGQSTAPAKVRPRLEDLVRLDGRTD